MKNLSLLNKDDSWHVVESVDVDAGSPTKRFNIFHGKTQLGQMNEKSQAHLVAAAPEMLRSLKMLHTFLYDRNRDSSHFSAMALVADFAIHKAEPFRKYF
jgi:hypothetical protein